MKRTALMVVSTVLTCAFFACSTESAQTAPAKEPAKAPASTATAQPAKPAAASPAKAADTLILTARVIEIPGKFPPNDLYNYVYVMKYRVVKIEKGSYTGQEILVGQYNPLVARKQIKDKMDPNVDGDVTKFELGATHRLVLTTPIEKVWKDAVEDEYIDSDQPKYYAFRTDIAK